MKRFHQIIIFITLLLMGTIIWFFVRTTNSNTIKVGILHSLTGVLQISEQPIANATLLAIEEINDRGGLLGKKIEPIIVDGKSNPKDFEKGATELIKTHHVACIFGCWSSTSRRQIRPIIEQENSILFYPVQYEGLEESPNIIYTGSAPNQTILPGITWSFYNLGKKFYLIGSDSTFSHIINELIKLHGVALGAEIIGEIYIPWNSQKVEQAITEIQLLNPEVIFNTLGGNSYDAFFLALRAANISSEKTPTVSFRITESELAPFTGTSMVGDYAVLNYFQTINRDENLKFIENFKRRFGQDASLSNNMESAYDAVYLWSQAVKQAKTTDPATILSALKKQVFNGPGSIIYLDNNNHAWRETFIGRIRYDKQFDIVWRSLKDIKPEPYPHYFSKKEWDQLFNQSKESWGAFSEKH